MSLSASATLRRKSQGEAGQNAITVMADPGTIVNHYDAADTSGYNDYFFHVYFREGTEEATYTYKQTQNVDHAILSPYDGKGLSTTYFRVRIYKKFKPSGTIILTLTYGSRQYQLSIPVVTVSDGAKGDKGDDGNSVTIKGTKDSSADLPTEGNTVGDGYIIDGDLWVWTEEGTWVNVGRIKGENGNGIETIINYYVASALSIGVSAGTDPADDEHWTQQIQTPTAEKPYLWNYEYTCMTDGVETDTAAHIIGQYVKDGRSIAAITEYYLASALSSGVTVKGYTWSTESVAPTEAKPYVWNYEVITYDDNTTTTTEPHVIGMRGDNGKEVVDITTNYLISDKPAGVTLDDEGWTSTVLVPIKAKPYLWAYDEYYYSDETSDPMSPRIIGVRGSDGTTPDEAWTYRCNPEVLTLSEDDLAFDAATKTFTVKLNSGYGARVPFEAYYGTEKAEVVIDELTGYDNCNAWYDGPAVSDNIWVNSIKAEQVKDADGNAVQDDGADVYVPKAKASITFTFMAAVDNHPTLYGEFTCNILINYAKATKEFYITKETFVSRFSKIETEQGEMTQDMSSIEQKAESINLSVTQMGDGLKKSGVDIEAGKIAVTTDQFLVTNAAGETTASVNADGVLEAKDMVANGGTFNAITVNKGTFNDIIVNGSVHTPFTIGALGSETCNDNIIDLGNMLFSMGLAWNVKQSGRRVIIANSYWAQTLAMYGTKFTAPSGYYFFENGVTKSTLSLFREAVEMIGYGSSDTFLGWIVLRRMPLVSRYRYGMEKRILMEGRVTVDGSTASARYNTCLDGVTVKIQRTARGYYGVQVTCGTDSELTDGTQWFKDADDMLVRVQGEGLTVQDNLPCYAVVTERKIESSTSFSFSVMTSGDASARDGSFTFELSSLATQDTPTAWVTVQ